MSELSNQPVPDVAEDNAFFPSPYSLSLYTAPKSDYDGTTYPNPYKGSKKFLLLGADERYLQMENGKFFSTGNHPVELLLPLFHIDAAGFNVDVATVSGNPVKIEYWAMPKEDETILNTYAKFKNQLKNPLKLSEIIEKATSADSPYAGVFIPGGHGAMAGIPQSKDVKNLLNWTLRDDKYLVTLCHGPAALVAASIDEKDFPFKDYTVCVFPDSLDTGANQQIGYMPGQLKWLVADTLKKLGVKIANEDITGKVHKDRKLLSGDSPLASNNLGKLTAETLLADPEFAN